VIQVGNNLYLRRNDLQTHLHCTGLSRSGKSKLAELLIRQLIRSRKSFLLIDPNGSLFRDLVGWLAYIQPSSPPILADWAYGERIPGYNPFQAKQNGQDYLMTKTERMVSAISIAGGGIAGKEGPRLAKFLRAIIYALLQQQLSIAAADHFLNWHSKERKAIIERIDNEAIRTTLIKLYSGSQQAFETYIESTGNRLQLFIHPHVRRIMGVADNCIDLEDVVDSGKSVLVNLQPSDRLTVGSVIGTLLINELWEIFRKKRKPKEFYLIMDECQMFFTPDIGEMLDQGAKYGLHLFLFHQHMGHIPAVHVPALANAQTKIQFNSDEFMPQQRLFMLTRPNGFKLLDEVPLVHDYPLKPQTVSKYTNKLLRNYRSIEELDKALTNARSDKRDKKELSDEDFYR
jgi:hypothetical protein